MVGPPARIRVAVIGMGTVGRWLLAAIERDREALATHGIELEVVATARRDGLVELASGRRFATALAGLEAIEYDVLAEVSQSPMEDGEPGISHMRSALGRGIPAATSNKWPVALAGVELATLARDAGAAFRAESTVMSGTPVLAALAGLGGARPRRLRGVLNATVNFVCTRLAAGDDYENALAQAKSAGLAEPDPSADVDGFDSVAKLMVLSALVFGRQLSVSDVSVKGISALRPEEVREILDRGQRVREVAVLDPDAGVAAVQAGAVDPDDRLFDVDEVINSFTLEADPLGEVTISGPGAGPELAGLGVLSDLIAIGRELAARRR